MGRQPQGHLEADPSAGVQQVLGGSQVQQQKVIFKGHGDKTAAALKESVQQGGSQGKCPHRSSDGHSGASDTPRARQ